MAIQKKKYELSVWKEELADGGSKIETKLYTIGAHDMTYLGRATAIKLVKKINGTQTLTFQMPDKYFDSEKGKYVRNELADELFAERKIKLNYDNEWFEFFVKKVTDNKQFKSYMKNYECTDAFIDELSRNGYGVTFHEDLYNNVEEIGTFSETILEDSIWTYHAEHNWGDFTEVLEERLYKIPTALFKTIKGYKLNFNIEEAEDTDISNVYTNESRKMEMGDDLAREKGYFWDQQNGDNPLKETLLTNLEDIAGDYIYVPYSCLDFCYGDTSEPSGETITYDRAATETAQFYPNDTSKRLAVAPPSVDPRTLIQFLILPNLDKIEVDDAGVIVDKNYTYFMTLRQWNENLKNNIWYIFEDTRLVNAEVLSSTDLSDTTISHTYRYLYDYDDTQILNTYREALGNKAVYYDGYLGDIGENNLIKGKKIQISNRTELNISEEIDQYVTVYKNRASSDFPDKDIYTSEEWPVEEITNNYRVCSKTATRQIVPQLARNLVQNGIDIQSTDGWASMQPEVDSSNFSGEAIIENAVTGGQISLRVHSIETENTISAKENFLYYQPPHKDLGYLWSSSNGPNYVNIGNIFYTYYNNNGVMELTQAFIKGDDNYKQIKPQPKKDSATGKQEILTIWAWEDSNDHKLKLFWRINGQKKGHENLSKDNFSVVNFGLVGQEKKIEKGKIYCLGIIGALQDSNHHPLTIKIGKGGMMADGDYSLVDSSNIINFTFPLGGGSGAQADAFWRQLDLNNGSFDNFNENWIGEKFLLFKANKTIENPYVCLYCQGRYIIKEFYLFEAYTKGLDFFKKAAYRYSGRDLFGNEEFLKTSGDLKILPTEWENHTLWTSTTQTLKKSDIQSFIIFEEDVMSGSTYSYQQYFIQRAVFTEPGSDGNSTAYDTMGAKAYIDSKNIKEGQLPCDAAIYTEDNYKIETNYLDLNKCKYYNPNGNYTTCDCCYPNSNGEATHTCYYQKFGYCPYRFIPEKHCRKIRTLKGEKSNRFNLIQETSKIFECYPIFYISHYSNGKIKNDQNGIPDKEVFYMTEKGVENKIGFRYEKNLSNINRTIESNKIVTKLYVQDVDSEISKTGLCSIKTAEDNPTKDSFIIDFSYYTKQGMLKESTVEEDLWGKTSNSAESIKKNIVPHGYLKQLGYYNTSYDFLTNKIINLQDASFNELEANLQVNLTGIETAKKQINKITKEMDKYRVLRDDLSENQTYQNQKAKLEEQQAILLRLIKSTFFTEGIPDTSVETYASIGSYLNVSTTVMRSKTNAIEWFNCIEDFTGLMKIWVDKHVYTKGILGQFNKEYNQLQMWKKERASYLKMINEISTSFFKKYESYLKEGTWSDSNFISDNAYYFGALNVAAEGAIPKVSYNITVVDLNSLPEYADDFIFNVADTTYIEDIGMFGINQRTGLPNRLKVLISEISYDLEQPFKNSIKIQNFTTQFEDLFQQVTSSVQSLTYNENIYKRSSNFTSLQNIEKDSLQGTLDGNDLTLLNTDEGNISVDNTGTAGSDINNHANKYKLDGQGLFFSNDGGEHWNVGVGPSGINADYIKVGTLDAGKIRIADSGYIYFAWDKEGIFAYRDPADVNTDSSNIGDYASFNKYGLTLTQDGKIRLRAGYSYTGKTTATAEAPDEADIGDTSTENSPGNSIGFYLFNNRGESIFQTVTDTSLSARLQLSGEIYATDDSLEGGESRVTKVKYKFSNAYQNVQTVICRKLTPVTVSKVIKSVLRQSIIDHIYMENGSDKKYYYRIFCNYVITFTDDTIESYILKTTTLNTAQAENKTFSQLGLIPYKQSSVSETIRTYSGQTSSSATYHIEGTLVDIYERVSRSTGNSPKTCYLAAVSSGTSYWETRQQDGTEIYEYGAAAIFINNKESVDSGAATPLGYEKRLFAAVRKNGSQFDNILTVLKNGTLAIGGTIRDELIGNSDLSMLGDAVKINNPGIIMTSEGQIQMDFKNFTDLNGKDLISVITDQIGSAIENIAPHFHFFAGDWGHNYFGYWGDNNRDPGYSGDSFDKNKFNTLVDAVADLYRGLSDKFLSTYNGTETSTLSLPETE